MAATDVLPWLPGGITLTLSMVSVSDARLRHDGYRLRMSLYATVLGLVAILVTTGFGNAPRAGFFTLFSIGFGALCGYLRHQKLRTNN